MYEHVLSFETESSVTSSHMVRNLESGKFERVLFLSNFPMEFGALKDRLVLESLLLLLGVRYCCFKHFTFCCRRFLPHRRAGAVGSTFCCCAACDDRDSFMRRWRGVVLHEGCRMMPGS